MPGVKLPAAPVQSAEADLEKSNDLREMLPEIFLDPALQNLRTRRPISINNSLVHGICNYSCKLCGVNKPHFRGPKGFQSRQVTKGLLQRVKEAARAGIQVRYIANAGDGEPTLHPEFKEQMAMFGDLIRNWDVIGMEPPEVSVVTNGARLLEPGVLETFTANPLTLIISFPTPDPEGYGEGLKHGLKGFWKLKISHYRVIYRIDKGTVQVLVLKAGLRRDKEVYQEMLFRLNKL
jgi:mRNA-degrading endonuclease RelE of RelBE toxin-antitoxin system